MSSWCSHSGFKLTPNDKTLKQKKNVPIMLPVCLSPQQRLEVGARLVFFFFFFTDSWQRRLVKRKQTDWFLERWQIDWKGFGRELGKDGGVSFRSSCVAGLRLMGQPSNHCLPDQGNFWWDESTFIHHQQIIERDSVLGSGREVGLG